MLEIVLPKTEMYDSETSKFIDVEEVTLRLEHSLISLSKWESIYEKPFLDEEPRTQEESLAYIHAMSLDDISIETLNRLTQIQMNEIGAHIAAKKTATFFNDLSEKKPGGRKSVITSELIYYWMISYGIPFECQYWHLNRLMTLIKVCNNKNAPEQKMSRKDTMARNKMLNEQRKAQFKTKG